LADSTVTPELVDRRKGDYALAEDIVWLKAEDGSSRLFDMERSSYGLNESATRMLDGVLNGTVDETISNLANDFQVDQSTIKFDLVELIGRLASSELIVLNGGTRSKDKNILHLLISGTCHLIFRGIILPVSKIQTEASLTLSVLRMFVRFSSLSQLVAILDGYLPAGNSSADHSEEERIVDEVESAVISSVRGLLLETACKERALCCWFMLRRRGVPATLVVGVTLNPVSGHSWCRYGERIVGDTIERCCDFTVIWRH
jgi:hypothetical protein